MEEVWSELENYNLGQLAIIIQPMGAYLTITITKTQYIFFFFKRKTHFGSET